MRKSYLNKIKANISIYARKNTSSLLDGTYHSIFKGKSLNFDDLMLSILLCISKFSILR